jgi:hypothetical protein
MSILTTLANLHAFWNPCITLQNLGLDHIHEDMKMHIFFLVDFGVNGK